MKLFDKRYEEMAREIESLRVSVKRLTNEAYGEIYSVFPTKDPGLRYRTKMLESQVKDVEQTLQGVMKALLSLGVVAELKQLAEVDFFFEKNPMVIKGKKVKK